MILFYMLVRRDGKVLLFVEGKVSISLSFLTFQLYDVAFSLGELCLDTNGQTRPE